MKWRKVNGRLTIDTSYYSRLFHCSFIPRSEWRGYGSLATFRGNHNMSKARVLTILWSAKTWRRRGFTPREISELSGVCLAGCYAGLARWYGWRYVLRSDTRPYRYAIASRGIKFVEHRIPLPVYESFEDDLQKRVKKYISEFRL